IVVRIDRQDLVDDVQRRFVLAILDGEAGVGSEPAYRLLPLLAVARLALLGFPISTFTILQLLDTQYLRFPLIHRAAEVADRLVHFRQLRASQDSRVGVSGSASLLKGKPGKLEIILLRRRAGLGLRLLVVVEDQVPLNLTLLVEGAARIGPAALVRPGCIPQPLEPLGGLLVVRIKLKRLFVG